MAAEIGKPERETQNRVIALFRDELGYDGLGNWAQPQGEILTSVGQLLWTQAGW